MYQPQNNSNNQTIEHRNELADYLEQRLIFKGKCIAFKYRAQSHQYQITINELKAMSSQISHLKLDYHVNLWSVPKHVADIGLGYLIEFEAIPYVYFTIKKIDGIDVKVKNYGLRLLNIIDYEEPERGEK